MSQKMINCKSCSSEIASSAKSCPNCGAKNKKPFFKKWWFWLIIVLLLIVIIGASSTDDSNTNDKPADSQQAVDSVDVDIWTNGGTYKVGSEIPAGEYIVVATGGTGCYVEVSKDSSGSFESIVSNDNTYTRLYITVMDGQYFKVSGGKFALENKVAPYVAENNIYDQGCYKVGKDIPAGEYKITANDSYCYIEVSKDSLGVFSSIVSNDNLALGESTYVTVTDGQYLKFNGGQIVK